MKTADTKKTYTYHENLDEALNWTLESGVSLAQEVTDMAIGAAIASLGEEFHNFDTETTLEVIDGYIVVTFTWEAGPQTETGHDPAA